MYNYSLSLLTVMELASVVVLFLLSLAVSIDIGVGLEITCGSYNSKIRYNSYHLYYNFSIDIIMYIIPTNCICE